MQLTLASSALLCPLSGKVDLVCTSPCTPVFPLALHLLFEFPLRSSVVAGVAFFVPLWLSDFGLGLLELEASS